MVITPADYFIALGVFVVLCALALLIASKTLP
jgi:hypothetical protein